LGQKRTYLFSGVNTTLNFSSARENYIESRMALRGNHTLAGSQASENIALAGRHVPPVAGIAAHDGLAMLQ